MSAHPYKNKKIRLVKDQPYFSSFGYDFILPLCQNRHTTSTLGYDFILPLCQNRHTTHQRTVILLVLHIYNKLFGTLCQ